MSAASQMPSARSRVSPANSDSSLEPPVFLTPVDVDPRSWFSNERTCIEWLHSAGILGAFAAGLVTTNEQPARIAGIGLMIPAVFVVIHAARMQAKRSKQLDARAIDSHFDRVGPTLLTFLLSLSLLANLTLSIDRTFFSGRAYEPNSPGAGRISPLQYFYTTAAVLALGIATAVTLPAHLGGAEGASLTSSTLGQPFLELEPRAVNHGPLRPKLLYANERACIPLVARWLRAALWLPLIATLMVSDWLPHQVRSSTGRTCALWSRPPPLRSLQPPLRWAPSTRSQRCSLALASRRWLSASLGTRTTSTFGARGRSSAGATSAWMTRWARRCSRPRCWSPFWEG